MVFLFSILHFLSIRLLTTSNFEHFPIRQTSKFSDKWKPRFWFLFYFQLSVWTRSFSLLYTISVPVKFIRSICQIFELYLLNSIWCFWIAVHGVEYAFGAHEYSTTGIFEGVPKQCHGFRFRKSVLIGKTDMKPSEVRALMEELAQIYKGNAYNLITKNCNHFCNDACVKLTENSIPNWVNRLARIGKKTPLSFFPSVAC